MLAKVKLFEFTFLPHQLHWGRSRGKMELSKMMFFLTSLAFLANAISSPKGLFYQRRLQEQKALQEIYGRRRYDGTHSGYVRPIDTGYALAGYGFANSVFGLLIRDNTKYEELQRRKELIEKYRNKASEDASDDSDSETDDEKTES